MLGLMGAYVAPIGPTVTALSAATHVAGSCKTPRGTGIATPASVRVTYAIGNADYVNYSVKIYRDGVLVSTRSSAATTFDSSISGYVQGDNEAYTPVIVYRVDVVRSSDSHVMSTKSYTFSDSFGNCTGPL